MNGLDGLTEHQFFNMIQKMTTSPLHRVEHKNEATVTRAIIQWFKRKIKGRWETYFTEKQKQSMFNTMATDPNTSEQKSDAAAYLLWTITEHLTYV